MMDREEFLRQSAKELVDRVCALPLHAEAPTLLALVNVLLSMLEQHADQPAAVRLHMIEEHWAPLAKNAVMKAKGIEVPTPPKER